jgi:hypothetical protein
MEYTKFIKKHKLHTKLFQIEGAMGQTLTPNQVNAYEQNLALRQKGILMAER